MTAPTPRQFLRARARQNPPLWRALVADAESASRSLTGVAVKPSGAPAFWLVLHMMWEADGYLPLALWRVGTKLRSWGVPLLPTLLRRLAIVIGQVHIGAPVVLEPGLVLPHGQVVIDGLTHVGPGVMIMPFTTLGLVAGQYEGPTIGARVAIGTGAKVLGPVRIGKDARIGANTVVLRDVPRGATAVGVPARIVNTATDTTRK